MSNEIIAQKTEEAAVQACLSAYMSLNGNRMEKAFHPTAFMKSVDHKTGEFRDVPIPEFIDRMKNNPLTGRADTSLLSLNIESTAAQAKIRIETDTLIMTDFMNLLKIDGQWKIVSKIVARAEK